VRAKVFSTHRAANTIGAFVGPITAGFIADAVGWRVPFIVLAVPTFLLVVIAAVVLREPPRTGVHLSQGVPRFRDAFRVLWGVRTLRQIWFAFPFLAFTTIGLAPLFALYYDDLFGVSASARGVIQAFDAPFIVAGLLLAAPRIDRGMSKDSGRVMHRIGLAAVTIAVLILGAATAPRLWVGIVFAYSIVALGAVLLAGGIAIVSLVAPPEARASAFAFFNISALLGAVSLPIVGAISDAVGIRWGMAVLTPMMVIGGLFVASAGRFVNDDIARVNPDRVTPPTLGETETSGGSGGPLDR
jgi:branched-chain amino acid transport system ATP-binding protein